MSIQIEDLPLRAQEQARRQIAEQNAAAPVRVYPPPDAKAPNLKLTAPDFDLVPPPEDAKALRKTRHLEAAQQIEYMDRIRRCLDGEGNALPGRDGADLIFALANENAAGKGIGILRWKMGVKAGLPDIGVFVPAWFRGGHCCGLFLEFKREDGVASDVKPAQKAVQDALATTGYHVAVCYGWRRAFALTCEYLDWEEKVDGG